MSDKNFTIVGERCSGTNWLQSLLEDNFTFKFLPTFETYGLTTGASRWKHWWGFSNSDQIFKESNDRIHFLIVRDPYHWIHSMYKKKHHIEHNRLPFKEWLKSEFYSTVKEGKTFKEIEESGVYVDRKADNKRFKNIFELREYKSIYMLEKIPLLIDDFYFIRYEDLVNKTGEILTDIKDKFNLKLKSSDIKWDSVDGNNYLIEENYEIIKENLNPVVESRLGYKI